MEDPFSMAVVPEMAVVSVSGLIAIWKGDGPQQGKRGEQLSTNHLVFTS